VPQHDGRAKVLLRGMATATGFLLERRYVKHIDPLSDSLAGREAGFSGPTASVENLTCRAKLFLSH